ncbi:MAG: NADH-quinone oxidoreductase subunit A [Proteobacteria bacterium]|nr:NADH-quinone oxidoreductase subunit A [Pseudomonadota bacterium]
MLEHYFPILVFVAMAFAFGIVLVTAGRLSGGRNPDSEKNSPYECGFSPFESARLPFDVRFYLVAILFIIFDLETAFLFPWALAIRTIGWFGFIAMALFLGLLVIGFIYEWKKGALEWE